MEYSAPANVQTNYIHIALAMRSRSTLGMQSGVRRDHGEFHSGQIGCLRDRCNVQLNQQLPGEDDINNASRPLVPRYLCRLRHRIDEMAGKCGSQHK